MTIPYIEFISFQFESPNLMLIKAEDISTILGISTINHTISDYKYQVKIQIITKQGIAYPVLGNYRTISNRLIYALSDHKKLDLTKDFILRPSVGFIHKIEQMEPDNIHMEIDEFYGFQEVLFNKIVKEHTE